MPSKEYIIENQIFIDIRTVSEKLNLATCTLSQLCKKGAFPGSKKIKEGKVEKWVVPVEIVEEKLQKIKKISEMYYTISDLAQELMCSTLTIKSLIKKGELTSISYGKINYLEKDSKELENLFRYRDAICSGEFITREEAAEIFDVEIYTLIDYEKKHINSDDKFVYFNLTYLNKQALKIVVERLKPQLGFVTVKQAAEMLGVVSATICTRCTKGNVPGAYKTAAGKTNSWLIPLSYVEKEILKHKQKNLNLSSYISIKEFAKEMGVSEKVIRTKIKNGAVKDFEFIDNRWIMKYQYVEKYKENLTWLKRRENTNKVKNLSCYSKECMLKELEERINLKLVPQLKKINIFYMKYCTDLIGKTNSKGYRLKSKVTDLVKVYTNLVVKIPEDINLHTENHVHELLLGTKVAYRLQREFTTFLKFVYSHIDVEPKKQFRVQRNSKKGESIDNRIYSPEMYYDINHYARDLEKHVERSIRSATYANMWLYVLLHLTNVWRHTDIIEKMPNVPTSMLENMNIQMLSWFKEHRLSIDNSQRIINYLYLKLRPEVTNKTRAYLTFLIEPTLIECVATAVILSELHRRKNEKDKLLYTFMNRSKNVITPTREHLGFFYAKPELKVFRNLRMNRSTMTYFFYNVVEEGGESANVAINLAQHVRSHQSHQSTENYLSLMNRDGSVNRISRNLFERGHFGWLYNFIIITALEGNGITQSIEQRTNTIKTLKEDLTPVELEKWAEFLGQSQSKKNSVIIEVSKLSKNELIDLISRIFRNELPAKTRPGQCIKYPRCKYTSKSSCFGCEYFIPQFYILIEAAKEFKRIINSIKETKYEAIFKRDMTFLRAILTIMAEAKSYYGVKQTNGFLSSTEIKEGIESIKKKTFIE